MEDAFQQDIYVMVTMTVETCRMNKVAGDSFFLPFKLYSCRKLEIGNPKAIEIPCIHLLGMGLRETTRRLRITGNLS